MATNGIISHANNNALCEPSNAISRRASATENTVQSSLNNAVNLAATIASTDAVAGSPSRVLQNDGSQPPSRELLIKQLRGIEALLEIKTKEVTKLIDTLKISPQYDLEEYLEEYNSTCHQVHLLQLQRDRVKLQTILLQQQHDQQQQQRQQYQFVQASSTVAAGAVPTSHGSTNTFAHVISGEIRAAGDRNNDAFVASQSDHPQQKPVIEERGGNTTNERGSVAASAAAAAREYGSQSNATSITSLAQANSNDSPRASSSPRTHRPVAQTSNTAQLGSLPPAAAVSIMPPTSPALPSSSIPTPMLSRQQQVNYSSSPPGAKSDNHFNHSTTSSVAEPLTDSGIGSSNGSSGSNKQQLFSTSSSSNLSPSSVLMHSTSVLSSTSTNSSAAPSIIPDGFIQVYLPDGQHSRVKIVPGKTLRDVLSTKLTQRCLMPELCHAYKGQPEQSVEGGSTFYTRQPIEWNTDSAHLGCSTITVERDNTKEPTNITEFSFKWRRISHDLGRSSSILDRKPCYVCKSTVFRGFKCSQCKIKVHYECADKMPNICTSEPNPQAIRRLINQGFSAVPVSPGHNPNQFFDDNNPVDNHSNAGARSARAGSNVPATVSNAADAASGSLRAGRSTSEPDVSVHGVSSTSAANLDYAEIADAASKAGGGLLHPPDSNLLAFTPPASDASGVVDPKLLSSIAQRRQPGTTLAALHTHMQLPTVVVSRAETSSEVRASSLQQPAAVNRFAQFFNEDVCEEDNDAIVVVDNNWPVDAREVVCKWIVSEGSNYPQQLLIVQDGRTGPMLPRTPATATSLTPSSANASSSTATTPNSASFLTRAGSNHLLLNAVPPTPNAVDAVSTPTTSSGKNVRIRVQQQINQQQYLQQKFRQDTDRESMQDWEIPDAEICDRKQVGSGSFGTVYKAKWHGEVALKKLKVANPTKEQLEAFKNEVRVLKRLRHSNIVLFMGCVLQPNLAIVTEWCPGDSLYKKLHVDDAPLDNNQIFSVAEQTILGMEYLHAKNIIHRDLKSNNIFLKENWTVKIGDMGLSIVKTAWTGSGAGTSQNPRQPFGSILWMAPEIINPKLIAKDAEPYTEKSDVYAFGIVMYELWAAVLPYVGEPKDSIMWGVGRGTLKPDLTMLKKACPKGMRKLLVECISTDRNKRPSFHILLNAYADVMELVPRISRSMSDDRLHRASLKLSDYEQQQTSVVHSGRKQPVAPLPLQWQNNFRQYSSNISSSMLRNDDSVAGNGTLTDADTGALIVDALSRSSTPLATTPLFMSSSSAARAIDVVDGFAGQLEEIPPGDAAFGDALLESSSHFLRAKRLVSASPSNSMTYAKDRGNSPVLQPLDVNTTASFMALCMQQPPAPKSASPACMPNPSSSSSSSGASASSNRTKFFGTTPLSQFSQSSITGGSRHASTGSSIQQALPDVFVFPPPAPLGSGTTASVSTLDDSDAQNLSSQPTSGSSKSSNSATFTTLTSGATVHQFDPIVATTTRYMPARNRYLSNTRALSEERVVVASSNPQPRGPYVRRIKEEFESSSTPTPPPTTAEGKQ